MAYNPGMQEIGIVYVIGAPDGPQKIGHAKRLNHRLRAIQSANGFKLEVAGSFELPILEAQDVERYAHYLLRDRRLRGEWFDVSPTDAVAVVDRAIIEVRAGKRPLTSKTVLSRSKYLSAAGLSAVAAALKGARVKAGMTQATVARALGLSQPFVNDIEHGRRELGEQHYENLPEAIRTPVVKAALADLRERMNKLRALIRPN
jgi:DNA-binding XRE family transcriptional regulator